MINRSALAIAAATTAFTLVFAALIIYGLPTAAAAISTTVPASEEPAQTQPVAPAVAATVSNAISADQAASIALRAVPRARLIRTPEPVNFQGIAAFEVTLNTGVVYVDEVTGRILNDRARSVRNEREGREGRGREVEHSSPFGFSKEHGDDDD